MPYALHRLAAGSYDLVLDGTVIGGVVREVTAQGDAKCWRVELLENLPAAQRPSPFTAIEHEFTTFEEVTAWLGATEVADIGKPDCGPRT